MSAISGTFEFFHLKLDSQLVWCKCSIFTLPSEFLRIQCPKYQIGVFCSIHDLTYNSLTTTSSFEGVSGIIFPCKTIRVSVFVGSVTSPWWLKTCKRTQVSQSFLVSYFVNLEEASIINDFRLISVSVVSQLYSNNSFLDVRVWLQDLFQLCYTCHWTRPLLE